MASPMKCLATLSLALLLSSTAPFASADNTSPTAKSSAKAAASKNESPEMSSRYLWQHNLTPTPEMWFYLQERARREDPKAIVRRNAQKKAAERRQRIAIKKAKGHSSSRPNAYRTVFGDFYARTNRFSWDHYTRIWFQSDASDYNETTRR